MSSDHSQRTHRLAFRVSDEERQLVDERAAACGMTLSAYLRAAALGRLPRRRRRGDERDLVHQLARLGNSLRHLSRLAASSGKAETAAPDRGGSAPDRQRGARGDRPVIGKGRTGSSFGGLQSYLLKSQARDRDAAGLQEYLLDGKSGRDRVEWTSTRNLPTEDPRYAAAVMRATAEQNPRVQKPVYHLSLSASPGEQISKEKWERIADRVLIRLGLDDRQALVVAHNDTRHPHIHLMINRVHPEHLKAWHNGHDYQRIEKALRHIERDLKLREVPGHHYQLPGQQPPERTRTTDGERRQAERTGEPAWAERTRFKIYDDLKQAKSWGDLERRLAGHRLRLERRGGGLVITDGKNQVKASRVYRRASYRWLEQRFGMKFEAWRSGRRELVEAVARYQEVERRQAQLERDRDAAWRSLRQAERLVDERGRIREACRSGAAEFNRDLREVFRREDLPAVRRRFLAEVRRHGWAEAGRRLQEQPRRFGRLQRAWGLPTGGVSRRIQRADNLRSLAFGAADMAALRAARAAAGPPGFRALAEGLKLTQTCQRASRRHDALPDSKALLKQIAGRALALGVSSVSLVVAPSPLKVIRTAVKAAELAREVGRGMEM